MTVRKLLDGKGRFVSSIGSDVRVQDVVDQLETDDVAALVVTDDNESILGIISGRDIVRGVRQFGPDVANRPVGELMTRKVITCDIGEPLEKILNLMDTHQIRHVPIIDGGNLCGIINMLDVVKYRLKEIQTEAEALKEYVAGNA
jgi:CBS domain-containing protein